MSAVTLLPLFSLFAYNYRPDEPYKLSSGGLSAEYLDCRSALSIPMVLNQVCDALGSLLDPKIKAVGGLTMGADPLAVGLSVKSLAREKPVNWFSVRKEPKGHGQSRLIEGAVSPGDRVCVLEDVVTTGSSTVKAIRACRAAGLEVCQVLVVVDRQQDGMRAIYSEIGAWATVHSLYTISDIRATARRQQNGC
jgi:orotate phosphoribosyltransferase